MNLYLRLFRILFISLFQRSVGFHETAVLKFIVWPGDLDVNIHMNDGRYLSVMDLGRLNLTMRNGFLWRCLRRRWFPVIASVMVRYARSLKPFRRYELHTGVLCWDDEWIYMTQRFVHRGSLMAAGVVRIALVHGGARVPASRFMEEAGPGEPSPELPSWVKEWGMSEEMMKRGSTSQR